ncbi:Glycogen synthase [Actinoplanes sp. SE50]|uniref:glycosyltransferase family 4 protein n=1 Tax=unclassified Actinoplanes TaxID=2626549 RepID=UPI00023EBBDA|nr:MULTISPECIES: glycosyltransferase family 4 protein [unclassified Actinoplanes]AEV85695.1 Glycogen synthase [Actinoplanes sp. SE50/110]ATO84088.1 Glycogen synthase [Actinoplanes sp. SE50]SLM01498.1 glycogen synthase [Actinoplanes sp. SE50/110]
MTRVAHVIAEFSAREAMGRTVTETVRRVPGEHHLITTHVVDGAEVFAGAHELGGPLETFPLGRSAPLSAALAGIRPDLVHLHAGALGPLMALHPALRPYPKVLTVYAWPTLPGPVAWRRSGLAEMWSSNVLRPRVALTTVLPVPLAAAALRRAGVTTVLTPDPRVADRLGRPGGPAIVRYACGAPDDDRRARFDPDHPVIVFAGRAETVRGLDTLLDAFRAVRAEVPGVRLRLLLIPRPELPAILARAGAAGDAIDVVTDPVPDLLGEFAAAQAGAWPFKFDYTTSPPAMALVEAMAVGLPVVGTDVACVRAVLEPGVNGLSVPPADPRALARALIRLLTDEPAWQRYARAGRASARDHMGWDRATALTADAYRSVLGGLADRLTSG